MWSNCSNGSTRQLSKVVSKEYNPKILSQFKIKYSIRSTIKSTTPLPSHFAVSCSKLKKSIFRIKTTISRKILSQKRILRVFCSNCVYFFVLFKKFISIITRKTGQWACVMSRIQFKPWLLWELLWDFW